MANKEYTNLILLGIGISLAIGLFLNSFIDAIKFCLIYSILFYIPVLPWTIKIKKLTKFGKYLLTNLIGLSLIPFIYAIMGMYTSLNTILFLIPPIAIFILGVFIKKN